MPNSIYIYLFFLSAYLIGSFSTAIVTCKLMGLPDPRAGGSNNPGATNVLRLGGKKAAVITLFGDLLKGLIPVLAASLLDIKGTNLSLVGLFAFLGHIFPLYYGFKGGKGVATYFGVVLALNWPSALFAVTIWLFFAFVLKISSLAALSALLAMPFIFYFFTNAPIYASLIIALMTLISFWRHKTNIVALLNGSETKIRTDNP